MSGFRLLDLVNFFTTFLPEVEGAPEKVSFDERIIFTVGTGIIYLVGQLPIYGLRNSAPLLVSDPFYSFRLVFGMEKATLFELGLLPVITAGFVWQLAAGLRLLNVNLNYRSDRELFQTGQKLTAFVLAAVMAFGLVFTGYYDQALPGHTFTSSASTLGWNIGIFFQITAWSWLVTLFVEIFDKGYAFGLGILCFMALQSATTLIRSLAAVESYTLAASNKLEAYGAFVNLFRKFKLTEPSSIGLAVMSSFSRLYLPNFIHFYVGLAAMFVVVLLQNFRIEIPIRSTKMRGMANVFPIRMLYTGALPVLFAYTVLANIQVFGYLAVQLLAKLGLDLAITKLVLGNYTLDITSNLLIPTLGVLSYLTLATSLVDTITSPIRTTVFATVVVVLAVWFANKWAQISGSAPNDIAKQFKDQGITILGKRDVSVGKELSRVIPVAAVLGAFLLAVTAVIGDLFGGFGFAAAIVVGMVSAFGIIEEFMAESQQNGNFGAQMAQALGAGRG